MASSSNDVDEGGLELSTVDSVLNIDDKDRKGDDNNYYNYDDKNYDDSYNNNYDVDVVSLQLDWSMEQEIWHMLEAKINLMPRIEVVTAIVNALNRIQGHG